CSDTRRYKFKVKPKVIDLGLRLADVRAMNLQSEPVRYQSNVDPRDNLRRNGATEEECNFLVRYDERLGWVGDRVESNAMTSPQIGSWLEQKFRENGVRKVVPDREVLEMAFRRAYRRAPVQQAIDRFAKEEGDPIRAPEDLEAEVRKLMEGSNM